MRKTGYIVLAAAIVLCLCSCGKKEIQTSSKPETSAMVTEATTGQEASDKAKSYAIKYAVKINPEFTLCADEELCVTEVTAENEDAENLLAGVDVTGMTVSEAFEALTEEAQDQGYMTREKGNTVDIAIVEKDDEKMPTCHICGGCGTVICKECHGTGIYGECERCAGTGTIHFEAGPECWSCGGSGICPECDGSGEIVVTNGEDGGVVYAAEGEPEMGDCPACHGNGVCGNCHGGEYSGESHDEECEGCNGTGIIYCHDDLNGYSWCPCCWGSGVDGTGDPAYR